MKRSVVIGLAVIFCMTASLASAQSLWAMEVSHAAGQRASRR